MRTVVQAFMVYFLLFRKKLSSWAAASLNASSKLLYLQLALMIVLPTGFEAPTLAKADKGKQKIRRYRAKWGIGSIPPHYPLTNNYLTTIFALKFCQFATFN